jgi:hypothetical protein
LLVASMAAAAACQGQSAPPDERSLWLLWCEHTNAVNDHVAVASACSEFQARLPRDPLSVVARGCGAWHQLKVGRTNEAVALFEAMLAVPPGGTALQLAGAEMARGWLTRLDREVVRRALKTVYLRDVEFPASLEPLKALKLKEMPAFADRWGTPWSYRLSGAIKGLEKQQYRLESTHLESTSDLTKELAVPYASRIHFEPLGAVPGSTDVFEFTSARRKSILLQVGRQMDGITIAYLGVNLLVMTDGSHWRVLMKPK